MKDPYNAEDFRRARVGALLIVLVIGAALAVFFLDALIRLTTEGPRITVITPSAPGVEPGTVVWVAGRDVGRVLSVDFADPERGRERVEIVAVLGRGVERYIRSDARVTIQPGGLLEPVVVVIDPGTGALPWDIATPLTTAEPGIDPEVLRAMSRTLLASRDSLGAEADRLRSAIRRGGGTLASLAENPDVMKGAGETVRRARGVLAAATETGTVARLASDTVIEGHLARIRERLARLDTLDAQERAVRSFEETSAALEAFQSRVLALSARLDAGEGSAGRWLNDGELGRQFALLQARMDSLTTELAKRPDLWLRVKVF